VNAVEIIERVREHDAELVIRDHRLIVRGANGLPDDLRREVAEHKAELLVALGVPLDRTIASILADIRTNLPPALRRLPDDRLLTLVNWSIIAAFESSVRKVSR
jgi:hypothetical protein